MAVFSPPQLLLICYVSFVLMQVLCALMRALCCLWQRQAFSQPPSAFLRKRPEFWACLEECLMRGACTWHVHARLLLYISSYTMLGGVCTARCVFANHIDRHAGNISYSCVFLVFNSPGVTDPKDWQPTQDPWLQLSEAYAWQILLLASFAQNSRSGSQKDQVAGECCFEMIMQKEFQCVIGSFIHSFICLYKHDTFFPTHTTKPESPPLNNRLLYFSCFTEDAAPASSQQQPQEHTINLE